MDNISALTFLAKIRTVSKTKLTISALSLSKKKVQHNSTLLRFTIDSAISAEDASPLVDCIAYLISTLFFSSTRRLSMVAFSGECCILDIITNKSKCSISILTTLLFFIQPSSNIASL